MAEDHKLVTDVQVLTARLAEARGSVERRFVGQHAVVEQVLAAILSGGHALLVGQPGLGKTMLVDTLATVLGLDTARIQFTPDLMPADILGSEVLDIRPDGSRAFRFIEGPVFTQLLMADEINRASPRTQSALLQAMQEAEVTIGGEHRPLGRPFHVLATQNPIEQEGTYPLPEAQLDRFLLEIDVGYPDREAERRILLETTGAAEYKPSQAMTSETLMSIQRLVRRLPVGDAVIDAILDLVRSARPGEGEERQNPHGRHAKKQRKNSAERRTGRDPEHSWMVGDHHTDLEAARRAGVRSIFLQSGFGNPGDETPDLAFPDFAAFAARFLADA